MPNFLPPTPAGSMAPHFRFFFEELARYVAHPWPADPIRERETFHSQQCISQLEIDDARDPRFLDYVLRSLTSGHARLLAPHVQRGYRLDCNSPSFTFTDLAVRREWLVRIDSVAGLNLSPPVTYARATLELRQHIYEGVLRALSVPAHLLEGPVYGPSLLRDAYPGWVAHDAMRRAYEAAAGRSQPAPPEEPVTTDSLRALLGEPHDGGADADGQRRSVVHFTPEGGFSEN